MATCFAGVLGGANAAGAATAAAGATGAAGAALGLSTFDYNRENFLGDRDQRLEKEFQSMDMSIEQVKQWREDVEDLVSLTEKKMHIYNLTTILLVLITIFLWCEVEDTLDPKTPTWLICGFALANTGAFMFLMLSIWLAIYSAVVAQGYNVRLRTQMVRLPIPSWQEIEACRTYASQFESIEGRQMFRVPFMMGRQEDLAKASRACSDAAQSAATSPAQMPAPSTVEPAAASTDNNREKTTEVEFADPWGLEKRADNVKKLGCPLGAEVANLRHIKMTRQAATLWQTYDSFARVSLSIGINQLLLAISYYFIAYLLVDVKCHVAAIVAVASLIVVADAVLKLEISLQDWQLSVAQFFGVLGPVMGLMAAWQGAKATELSELVSRWCIPFAFLAHAVYLLFMIYLCKVKVQPNGARVPAGFKQALYLDAFGWIKADGSEGPTSTTSTQASAATRPLPEKPAMSTVKYNEAGPCPTRPQDLAPRAHSDMRAEEGACDPGKRLGVDSKVKVPFYHWGFDGLYEDDGGSEEAIVTGHEAESPGVWPWMIFHSGLLLLALVWVAAAMWRLEIAIELSRSAVSTEIAHLEKEIRNLERNSTGPAASSALLQNVVRADSELHEASLSHMFRLWASSYLGDLASDNPPESIPTAWPPQFLPRTISCDASGQQFVVNDGLLAFSAKLEHHPEGVRWAASVNFAEMACSALVGESMQDLAVACDADGAGCQALFLHRNGRQITACGRPREKANFNATQISDTWLEHDDVKNIEEVASVVVRPSCKGDLTHCFYAHTTHGQVVQLRQRTRSKQLIPNEILQEARGQTGKLQQSPGSMRAFNSRYLGVLQTGRQSIDILDASNGGLNVGKLLLPPAMTTKAWCTGAGYLFLLSGGQQPELMRMRLPRALSVDLT